MRFRNIKIKTLLTHLIVACLYPLFKFVSSDAAQKILNTINAATLTGLAFLLVGVLYSFALHGDLDITEYIAKRSLFKGVKPFSAFREDKKNEREGSFNYPLFVGILLLAAAFAVTPFFY